MLRLLVAGLLAGMIAQGAVGSCWIQDAAAFDNTVWLLCQQGGLLVSEDGGAGWREQALPTESKLRAVELVDARRGFIVGDNATLLMSEDGGRTWTRLSVPAREHLTAIHFVGRHGWIAGWGGTILHSSDGGRTWSRQLTPTPYSLEGIYFVDPEYGWAVGWTGAILRTTDGGKTWEALRSPVASWSLSAVYFRDRREGWAVGFGGQILHSRDGGQTWELLDSPVRDWLTAILFDETGRGWITTSDGFLVSDDGGRTWQKAPLNQPVFLSRMVQTRGALWAVGPFGVLKRTTDSLAWQRIEVGSAERAAGAATASTTS